MKKFFFPLLILVVTVACQPSEENHNSGVSKKFDSLFLNYPDFSGVVLVADAGTPVYQKAYGYKNFHTRSPMESNDLFELASVSKQFTAMIIVMLQEDGLLDYDDDIGKYIPDLPYKGITIRHLLHHTSGLPDYQAVMDQHWDKSKIAGNEECIEYLKLYHPPAHFAPGEKYEYSNTGYLLLASIAEKASGKDFIELCRSNIFRPLSMSDTDIRTTSDKLNLPHMAWGHIYVSGKGTYVQADSFPAFNYNIWLGNREGPGRISAPASDLLKWDRALYSGTLIKTESLDLSYSPARLNNGNLSRYGFGWMLGQHPVLGKKVFHTGDNPGYKTIIVRYVDARKTVILLCNNEHAKFDDIVKAIDNEISRVR